MSGWIKLHRSLSDHKLWTCEPFTKGQAWVDLLMLTNHSQGIMTIKNGLMIEVCRGECGYSELAFADRWKWSRGKVRRFFSLLAKEKMIQQKVVQNRTIIAICKYDEYQTVQQTVQQTDTKRTLNDTVNGHKQEEEEKQNEKKDRSNIYRFAPPTLSEVSAYCAERGGMVDSEKWYDFYASKGWMVGRNKMKDWKAAVRTWEKNGSKVPNGAQRPLTRDEQIRQQNDAVFKLLIEESRGL